MMFSGAGYVTVSWNLGTSEAGGTPSRCAEIIDPEHKYFYGFVTNRLVSEQEIGHGGRDVKT